MAAYDNKVLDGAGVAKLSQLIKEEIASSSGGSGGGTTYTAGAGIEIDDTTHKISRLNGFLSSDRITRFKSQTDNGYENSSLTWQGSSATTLAALKTNLQKYNICFCYFSSVLQVSDIQTMLAEIYPGHSQYIVNYYTSYTYEKSTGNYFHINTYVSSIPRNIALVAIPYMQSPSGLFNLQFIRSQDLPNGFIARSSRESVSSIPLVTNGNQTLADFANIMRNEISTVPNVYDYMNVNTIINGIIQHTNFSSLVSTETTPSTNNTINWLYE